MDDILRYEKIFKALADEHRIRILQNLMGGEMNAGQILDTLDIVQSTLSHHMKMLCESGLVKARRSGKWTCYQLSPQIAEEAAGYLMTFAKEAGAVQHGEETANRAADESGEETAATASKEAAEPDCVEKDPEERVDEASVQSEKETANQVAEESEKETARAEAKETAPKSAVDTSPVLKETGSSESGKKEKSARKEKSSNRKSKDKGKDKDKEKDREKDKGKSKEKGGKNKKKQ